MWKYKKTISLYFMFFGAMILNAVTSKQAAGNFNNFGIMSPYIASYFYHRDHSVRNSDFTIVPGIASISESITTLIISYLLKWIGPFYIILIIGSLSCSLMILSSLITDPMGFCWAYGIGLGSFSSTIFLPTVWILWNHIPQSKAKISGFILAVYSLGAVPFGLMFTFLANPNNENAEYIKGSNKSDRMFSKKVADNIQSTIQWTSGIYLICLFVGLFMLPRKMKEDQTKSANIKKISLFLK